LLAGGCRKATNSKAVGAPAPDGFAFVPPTPPVHPIPHTVPVRLSNWCEAPTHGLRKKERPQSDKESIAPVRARCCDLRATL
jgi:hypothetical protein